MKISYCQHCHGKPEPNSPALEIKNLEVSYSGEEKMVLRGINISIPVGRSMALVGPNGAGKSTLFKAISGVLPIHAGTISILGHPLEACHNRVVYLPQRSEIDWQFPISVLELVTTGRYVYLGWFKHPDRKDIDIARHSLEQMKISELCCRQINKLSGGQQQRVLIARALTQNADLFLLDEPLNAVDAATRQIVTGVLQTIRSQGKTVIVATHYYDPQEKLYDGAIYLKDGKQFIDDKENETGHHQGCDCS